jgi:hypothetical protein
MDEGPLRAGRSFDHIRVIIDAGRSRMFDG